MVKRRAGVQKKIPLCVCVGRGRFPKNARLFCVERTGMVGGEGRRRGEAFAFDNFFFVFHLGKDAPVVGAPRRRSATVHSAALRGCW